MDFDQMLDAWRAQDHQPVYGVNHDLLRMVLQHEQDRMRRSLRRDQWITYLVGPGMALFAAFWLWVVVLRNAPPLQVAAAAVSSTLFVLWVGAYWISRRRHAQRERSFGNTLKDEINRNLALVEYQIANARWGAALFWSAPAVVGASLIYWLTFQINTKSGFAVWNHAVMALCILSSVAWTAYAGNRQVIRVLEPRRQRLRDLLTALTAAE